LHPGAREGIIIGALATLWCARTLRRLTHRRMN